MTDRIYKNHPTVMIQNIAIVAVVLFIMFINFIGKDENLPIFVPLICLVVILAFIVLFYLSWKLTTISFYDDEIVVEHNLIFKKRKTIPYNKIASVNVVRNIFNRLFDTTTLSININSSRNASIPEANFVFDNDLANSLREELMAKMFKQTYTPEEKSGFESMVPFKPLDAVLYGLIGGPTVQTIYSLVFFIYSVIAVLFFSGSGLLIGILMLLAGTVIPCISLVLRYYNLKVYRVDNTICLQHGMIQTYRTSFEITRINAIRIRRPWIARLLNKCCLEAEVVGINAASNETTPLLCLLVKNSEIEGIMKSLVPEFICEVPTDHQPKTSRYPMLSRNTLFCVIFLAVMAIPDLWFKYGLEDYLISLGIGYTDIEITIAKYALPALTILIVFLSYISTHIAFNINEFGLGEDMFKIVR